MLVFVSRARTVAKQHRIAATPTRSLSSSQVSQRRHPPDTAAFICYHVKMWMDVVAIPPLISESVCQVYCCLLWLLLPNTWNQPRSKPAPLQPPPDLETLLTTAAAMLYVRVDAGMLLYSAVWCWRLIRKPEQPSIRWFRCILSIPWHRDSVTAHCSLLTTHRCDSRVPVILIEVPSPNTT